MSDTDLSPEKLKEIAEALDRVVNDLPWEQSVFLRALGKKFENIRDEFKQNVGLDESIEETIKKEKDKFSLQEGQLEVYVSIYNAQGVDIKSWARIIENLTHQSVSRPCYSTESSAREMIRSKENINNEAYVSVHISSEDVRDAPVDRVPRDRLGNILILLKEKAIMGSRIKKFYHRTGIYEYRSGMLSRIGDMNFSDG